MASSITIKGVDELSRKLTQAQRNDVLVPPMQRAVKAIQKDMAEYPGKPAPGEWARWVNSHSPEKAAQIRGAFFARLRSGGWSGRTGTLGRKWTDSVKRSSSGVVGKVGIKLDYAAWVQSSKFQAGLHSGRWKNTDDAVIRKHRRAIVADFERAIAKALR